MLCPLSAPSVGAEADTVSSSFSRARTSFSLSARTTLRALSEGLAAVSSLRFLLRFSWRDGSRISRTLFREIPSLRAIARKPSPACLSFSTRARFSASIIADTSCGGTWVACPLGPVRRGRGGRGFFKCFQGAIELLTECSHDLAGTIGLGVLDGLEEFVEDATQLPQRLRLR